MWKAVSVGDSSLILLKLTPLTRAVERMEEPSTNIMRICAHFAVYSLFVLPSI